MDTIIVKPRNKKELKFLIILLKRLDVLFQVETNEKERKKKGKKE
jgi:hypothetical protein